MEAARRLGLTESASRAPLPAPSGDELVYSGCCVCAKCFAQDPALRICDPIETFIATDYYPATAAVVSTRAISGFRKFIAPSLFPSEQSRASHVLQRDR